MADRFPLILNTSANQIQEIASGDTLDLTGSNVKGVGIITAANISGNIIAGAGTSNIVAGIITAVTIKSDVGDFVDLDVDGHTELDNVNIAGIVTANQIKLPDNKFLLIGTDNDLQLRHDGSHSYIQDTGTGSLYLTSNQFIFYSTTNENLATFNQNGSIDLYWDNSKKFETSSTGITVTGTVVATGADINGDLDVDGHTNLDNASIAGVSTFTGNADFSSGIDVTGTITGTSHVDLPDAAEIKLGDNDEFLIYHTATGTSYIKETGSGDLYLDATNIRLRSQNGNEKLATTSTGVSMTGNATVSGNLSVGGVLTYEDVTNVDSIGIITARNGITVSSGTATFQGAIDANGDLDVDGHTNLDNVSIAGVVTATSFVGALTGNSTSSDTVDITSDGSANTTMYPTFVNGNGSGKTLRLDSGLTYVPATNVLTAGTFSGSGASLTNLNGSNIASGTVSVARIGTGTKNTSTFYRGDGTFATVTAPAITAINGASNNRLVTSDGGTTVTAESELTYSTYLNLARSANDTNFGDNSAPGGVNGIFISNSQSTNGVFSAITLSANDVNGTNQSGSLVAKSVSGGYVPEVHITQRTGGNTNESNLKITSARAVELRHQGSTRLETTAEGVKIGRTMFTGSTTNVENEAIVISPSTSSGNGYHDNHVITLGQLSGNWLEGASGADTAFGMMFSYATGAAAAKHIRGGIVYDHKSTEELQIWSSYGSIAFYIDSANSGNETPVTCDIKCAEFDGSGHLVPGSNDARDLGTTGKRWRNIYVNDLQLSNEAKKDKGGNDVDGTWGDWTLQEGDENIFMLNNRTGKKYKINLTEVE